MILRIYALSTDDIEFSVKIDPDAAQFVADESQIEIVMQILIENAVDAIKGKGCIEVSAQTAQYLDKSFHNYIEIEVSDTGCGISADILEKIFEPYFSQKQEGTGMGLPIAKRIIEAHGGELEVRSRRNFASTFRFMLPIRNMDENSIIS